MKTIEITIYKFDELSEESKAKSIEKLYDINVDFHDWWEGVYEGFNTGNVTEYFEVGKMYFSGFSSQGDGAMFEYEGITGKLFHEAIDSLKLPNWKRQAMKAAGTFSGKGKQSGMYYHEKSCSHVLYFESEDAHRDNIIELFYNQHEALENYIESKYEDLARSLYADLEKEYDYRTGKEAVIESIKANEYEFTEDGKIH